MFARVLCALFCLAAFPAHAAHVIVAGPLTIGPDDPAGLSYSVQSTGQLTLLAGADVSEVNVSRHGQATIQGGRIQDRFWNFGNAVIDGGAFQDLLLFSGGTLQINEIDVHTIVAHDADCCGVLTINGGRIAGGVTSATVDNYGGAYTFHVSGGQIGNATRGFGSATQINLYGTEFAKTHSVNTQGFLPRPVVTVTGFLEDGNWFSFHAEGDWGAPTIDDSFYVLHDTGIRRPLAGDTNADAVVDITDLNNVRNNFGSAGVGDIDDSGAVDIGDLNAVRNNFGRFLTRPPTQAVPEPSSVVLAMLVGSMCLSCFQRSSRYCHHQPA